MIVFDLDDTLYQEREYVHSAFSAVVREANRLFPGIDLNVDETVRAMMTPGGMRAFDFLSRILGPQACVMGLDIDRMVDIYRHHPAPAIKPGPTVVETLQALTDRGERLGLITDGSSRTQRSKLNALGLEKFFAPEAIIISGETGYDKYSPRPFEILRGRFPDERRWTYIGDNPAKDFLHPNLNGWTTIMLSAPREGHGNVFGQDLNSYAPENRPSRVIFRLRDII